MNRKHYSVIKNFLHILLATGLNLKPYNTFAHFFFIVFSLFYLNSLFLVKLQEHSTLYQHP